MTRILWLSEKGYAAEANHHRQFFPSVYFDVFETPEDLMGKIDHGYDLLITGITYTGIDGFEGFINMVDRIYAKLEGFKDNCPNMLIASRDAADYSRDLDSYLMTYVKMPCTPIELKEKAGMVGINIDIKSLP